MREGLSPSTDRGMIWLQTAMRCNEYLTPGTTRIVDEITRTCFKRLVLEYTQRLLVSIGRYPVILPDLYVLKNDNIKETSLPF